MAENWPELNRAQQQRQAKAERERMERGAPSLPQNKEEHVESEQAIEELETRLGPHQDRMLELARSWNPRVRPLLEQLAITTWGDSPDQRAHWIVEGKIIWRVESQTPSLYWEALYTQRRYIAWYGVELRTDLLILPVRFVITCNEADYTISTSLNVDALKAGLVQAFRLGPLDNIFHPEVSGIKI